MNRRIVVSPLRQDREGPFPPCGNLFGTRAVALLQVSPDLVISDAASRELT